MASATSPSYAYTRGSANATRSLIDSTTASPSNSGTATPSDPTSPHATLHRRKTNNYESALADRLNTTITQTTNEGPTAVSNMTNDTDSNANNGQGQSQGPRVVGTVAYKGDAAASQTPGSPPARPGLGGALGRQQSWKQADQKRGFMERMLSSDDGAGERKGYTSSNATAV